MPRQPPALSIEHALLGLLCEQPMHGYDLYQRLLAPHALGAIWPLKRPQFYALITKLEQAGYLCRVQEQQERYPPRQVLHPTEAGRAAFAAWLHSPAAFDADIQRDLLARLYFARRSGDAAVHTLLARQRTASQHEHDALRRELATLPDPTSYAALVLHWRLRHVDAILGWLDTHATPHIAGSLVSYPIAPLHDSHNPALARQFVAYVCAAAGQQVLLRHGFLVAESRPPTSDIPPAAPSGEPRTLTVCAAASLTAAFRELGRQFETAHPGTRITFRFAGSHHLAHHLVGGMPADVFASAHHVPMEHVIAAGRVLRERQCICAYNRLAVVTKRSNPTRLLNLADLGQPGRKLVFGSDGTAVGHYALDLLDQGEQMGDLGTRGRLAVLQNVVGYADTPHAVLEHLMAGDADVGIVFASDCTGVAEHVVSPLVYPAVLPWSTS